MEMLVGKKVVMPLEKIDNLSYHFIYENKETKIKSMTSGKVVGVDARFINYTMKKGDFTGKRIPSKGKIAYVKVADKAQDRWILYKGLVFKSERDDYNRVVTLIDVVAYKEKLEDNKSRSLIFK